MKNRKNNLIKLCNKFGIKKSAALDYHIKCGMHSGILDCCIIFWLTKFSGKFKTKVMYNNKEANDYFDKLSEKWVVTYIACPSCFKSKKFIEIKKCNCGL